MAIRKLLLVCLLPVTASAMGSLSGYCTQGGQKIVTNSIPSTTQVQQSYPQCSVTVYYTGGPSGSVTTSGTTVTWKAGTTFNANGQWAGLQITINSAVYTISSVSSTQSLTLTSSPPTYSTPVAYSMAATTPAPIFTSTSSAMSNPFTSSLQGYWQFYSDNGQYDVKLSGGGFPAPVTWGAQTLIDALSLPMTVSSQYYLNRGKSFYQACADVVTRKWSLAIDVPWYAITGSSTCAASLVGGFPNGLIQPANGQAITLSGPIASPPVQIFDTQLGGSIRLTGPNAVNYANWFGASSVSADNTAAVVAAYAADPYALGFACGTYAFTSGLTFATTGSSIRGSSQPCVTLQYTGSGTITDFVVAGSDAGVTNFTLGDMTISGNGHVTNALRALELNQSSAVSNVQLKNATGTCLLVDTNVSSTFTNVGCTNSTGTMTTIPAVGIDINSSVSSTNNTVTFVSPVTEYIANTSTSPGIKVTTCAACKFIGGTSESNGVNIELDAAAGTTQIIGMDNEVPCTANIVDKGTQNIVDHGLYAGVSRQSGCSATPPSVHYTSTSVQGTALGIIGDQIVIDSGAMQIDLENNSLGNNFGSATTDILDSGTLTLLLNNHHCCGAGALPIQQKIPGAVFIGTSGSGNVNVALLGQPRMQFTPNTAGECMGSGTGCSGASANNALTASLAYPDGSLVPVAAGLRITIFCTHSLRAGVNTLNLNNTGAIDIIRASDGGNLSTPFSGSGLPIDFVNYGGTNWVAMGMQ